MRTVVLIILALVSLVFAGLRAAGRFDGTPAATPRELAATVLPAADALTSDASANVAPLFTDVAAALGVNFTHDAAMRGACRLPEVMGPGAGLLDFDGDGDLDLFVAGGGAIEAGEPIQTCRLFRNDGASFVDVTEASGAGVPGPAYGVACADYDDDGDVDVLITRLGPNALLRNAGDGTFREVGEEAGVAADGFGASAVFLDYDRDGRLDLYVTNYVDWAIDRETACHAILGERDYCGPLSYDAASRDRLYHNLGGGRFEDVSVAAGIASDVGNGLGVLASDFDGDGWIDIYVANDLTPAFLWHNEGDGTFTNVAALAGCAYDGRGVAIAGMGTACEDFDGDGDFDLFVTNVREQSHLLLTNDGKLFRDESLAFGVGVWSIPATAFGIAVFDQDHDGRLDAFIANGDISVANGPPDGSNRLAQPDHFLRLIDREFVDATATSGAAFADVGRAVVPGDIDGDGDIDLIVMNCGGSVRILRNDGDARAAAAWLLVDARTGPGRRAAIGARITVTNGERSWRREIRPQQSYLASGDPRAHFGLGDLGGLVGAGTRVDHIEVVWPDAGPPTVLTDVLVNQVLVVEQRVERSVDP